MPTNAPEAMRQMSATDAALADITSLQAAMDVAERAREVAEHAREVAEQVRRELEIEVREAENSRRVAEHVRGMAESKRQEGFRSMCDQLLMLSGEIQELCAAIPRADIEEL